MFPTYREQVAALDKAVKILKIQYVNSNNIKQWQYTATSLGGFLLHVYGTEHCFVCNQLTRSEEIKARNNTAQFWWTLLAQIWLQYT